MTAQPVTATATPARPVAEPNTLDARLARAISPSEPEPELLVSDEAPPGWPAEARKHRIASLCASLLEERSLLQQLPSADRRSLRTCVLEDFSSRQILDELAIQAFQLLDAAGTRPVLVKGAALGLAVYPQPQLRPMGDVDLLVSETRLDVALRALDRAGYGIPGEKELRFWRSAFYNLPVKAPNDRGSLDLHWTLAQPERHHPDTTAIIDRAETLQHGGVTLRVPAPVDLLLHQTLHHAYHYFEPKLAWLYDIALLYRCSPDTATLLSRAREWGMSVALALSIRQIEETFPGTVPTDLRDWSQRSRRSRRLLALLGSRDPVRLLRGTNDRLVQLLVATAVLDRPATAIRSFGRWLYRTLRFGDAAGRHLPSALDL